MNAHETINPINDAHKVLMEADDALCVDEVARALLGGSRPGKKKIKAVSKELKKLADLGMIEIEPRAGGLPFYRLIAAPVAESSGVVIPPPPEYDPASVAFSGVPTKTYPPSVLRAMVADMAGDSEGGETDAPAADADGWIPWIATADSVRPVPNKTRVRVRLCGGREEVGRADIFGWNTINCIPIVAYKISQPACADFATTPELQYLSPEDYEMPPADPSLLASANKMLCERMNAIAEQLRAGTIPELENVTGAEDLAPHVKTLCDALADTESVATARGHTIAGLRLEVADLRESLDTQIKQWQVFAGRLNTQLDTEWRAREAQQEKGNATDVTAAAVGYLVRVPRRPPIIRRKLEAARLAALGAVRAGAARAEVLAVVPVGAARRGAEWGDA